MTNTHRFYAWLFGILAVTACAAEGQRGPLYFGETFPSGERMSDAFLADLDGDGDNDMVGAEQFRDSVAIFRNDGPEGMVFVGRLEVGRDPFRFAGGDFDGDGDTDLAVANRDPFVSVLINNGELALTVAQTVPARGDVLDLCFADADGDGLGDLVFTNEGRPLNTVRDEFTVALGTGTGSFLEPAATIAGDTPAAVEAADLDGDGIAEIVVSNTGGAATRGIAVFTRQADGSYEQSGRYEESFRIPDLAIADTNGDGAPDILAINELDELLITLTNNGEGTLTRTSTASTSRGPIVVRAADLDNDCDTDAIVINRISRDLGVYLNDGSGVFQPNQTLVAGDNAFAARIGDMDGDERPDIVYVPTDISGIGVHFNQGDAVFATDTPFPIAFEPFVLATGDVDMDGNADLMTGGRRSCIEVFTGDGEGGFSLADTIDTGGQPTRIAISDLNGDGTSDLAVAFSSSVNSLFVEIFFGEGEGTFDEPPLRIDRLGSTTNDIGIEDINNDGTPDLIAIGQGNPGFTVYRGLGGGEFAEVGSFDAGSNPYALASGDFDRDGDTDFLVTNLFGDEFRVLENAGDGTFTTAGIIPTCETVYDIEAADFDGDGILDCAALCNDSDRVALFLGTGDGGFVEAALYPTNGDTSTEMITGDINRNGRPDIIFAIRGGISVLLNDGGPENFTMRDFNGGFEPRSPVILDADGDGFIDIAVTNEPLGATQIRVLLNRSDEPRPCSPADIAAPRGQVDLADLVAFVGGFVLRFPDADRADPCGVFDLSDIGAYLDSFNAGCD